MAKVYVVFDYEDYEGSTGPHSVWNTADLASLEIMRLSMEQKFTQFRYEEFEVD